jgi:phenylpropionate dioxygenase-like ring-hydroxylating dioxygenase large terminal subunit
MFDSAALKDKARLVSYPVREAGGAIWIFMGPPDRIPAMPELEWALAPAENVHAARWLQRSNWAQGMEGEIDSSHISFLHREFVPRWSSGEQLVQSTSRIPPGTADGAPVMKLKETDYGFVYGARRNTGAGDFYWRITQWFLPMFSMIPNDIFPRTGRAWVPVDDDHVMVFTYGYRADRAYTQAERAYMDEGHSFPPPLAPRAHELPDGYVIDTWMPLAERANDYRIDRSRQKTVNFTGIDAITDQDRALQENMPSGFGLGPGRLVDRTREMLVPSDLPVITARRMLVKLARDLQKGIEPELPWQARRFRARSTSAVSAEAEFDDFLKAHEGEMQATL